jgi:formate dehydrogenase iron-sulfur subunit
MSTGSEQAEPSTRIVGNGARGRSAVSRESVQSFYHLRDVPLTGRHCQGLACFAARGRDPERWAQAVAETPRIDCLGKCYRAPASSDDDALPHVESRARDTVLLGNVLAGGVHALSEYRARAGGEALSQALTMGPAAIRAAIVQSGLRGRGGAGFPSGRKWDAVARAPGKRRYVVVNADEGDPGSFSDRFLIEDDPFLLIEATVIAGYAVGASAGYVYLRKEYPLAHRRLQAALDAARAGGMLGERILDSGYSFDLQITPGAGSYLCGEETAMLNAIEGKRPEARPRPPFIFEQGLFGAPTLVNNVETLCAVPWILRRGAEAYRALGVANSRGTKLLSLPSLFARPGLYEIEFGMTLREIVDGLGGGLKRGTLQALMVGGPLAGLIPPSLLDTPFGYEELQAIDAAVGHGGVIAFAGDTSIAEIAREVFRFGATESCGKCTPCHLGSPVLQRGFEAAAQLRSPVVSRAEFADLVAALEAASLCGHGRGLAEFARSLERHFAEDLRACLA